MITPDSAVSCYDFTDYWVSNPFNYFTDPLPPEGDYTVTEWQFAEGGWSRIVEALEESRFMGLPEEIPPFDGHDAPSYAIEVAANDNIYRSGGYGAGENTDKVSQRFKKVLDSLLEVLKRN